MPFPVPADLRVPAVGPGDHPASPGVGLLELRHHHDREALRDPFLAHRRHLLHVRDRQRHHGHLRVVFGVEEKNPRLDRRR